MSPAQAQLESVVDALRRKQLLAITVSAIIEMLLVGACVFALLRVGLPNIVLSKPRRLVLLVGLVLVFFAALLLEQARQSRSVLYLAKRIDEANQLDDHLVSAVSFATMPMSAYEQACINSFVLRLTQQRLRIPEVRLERVWLLLPALLVAGATGAIEYRRRTQPTDDGAVKITLPAELRDRIALIDPSKADKVDPKLSKQAAETRAKLDDLIAKTATKEDIMRTISQAKQQLTEYDAENPSVIDAALQLGDPSTQRASNLLSAIREGKPAAVNQALKELADALSGRKPPPLSDDERAEVSAMLAALGEATKAKALSDQLNNAATAVRNNDPKAAGAAARAIEGVKDPLNEELTREIATKRLTNALRAALADVAKQSSIQAKKALTGSGAPAGDTQHVDGGATGMPGTGDTQASDESDPTAEPNIGQGGTSHGDPGRGTAGATLDPTGSPEQPDTSTDVRVKSPWVNAPVKQLVAAGAASDDVARKMARSILGTERARLEREVRREEVPAEYAQSIRRYFYNIQQDWEQRWKSTK